MTRDHIIAKLLRMKGSRDKKELAIDLGISPQYLGDVLAGKREPGKAILDELGMEKSISYRTKKDSK
jgi:transcriptional regulator with XRE-family HTH domain